MNVGNCFIMRGLPGSGKSTWVEQNVRGDCQYLSTDFYFMENGVYKFEPKNLAKNHNKCLRAFVTSVAMGINTIVVDNTNICVFEIAPYYRIAEAYGYNVEIISLASINKEICKAHNIHNVPPSTIDRMFSHLQEQVLPSWWNIRNI